jgi:cholesterol oxidase
MMNVQLYPIDFDPYKQTKKAIELREAAKRLGHDPIPLRLAISFRTMVVTDPEHPDDARNRPVVGEPICETHRNLHDRTRYTCRLCGECDIGCNYGSKNTLDFNYLSEVRRLGAQIQTLSYSKSKVLFRGTIGKVTMSPSLRTIPQKKIGKPTPRE